MHKIKTDLLPVIKLGESIDLDGIKEMVKSFINQLMIPNDDEIAFINYFHQGIYKPELLFYDNEILKRIVNHPMAIWRIGKITDELR